MIKTAPKISKVLINQKEIQKKVKQLAKEISRDYQGKKLVLIGILKGAFVFMADLLRKITIPLELDFIQVSSYGASTTSSGIIKTGGVTDKMVFGISLIVSVFLFILLFSQI